MVKPNRKTRDSRLSKIQQRWIAPPKTECWAKIPIDILDGERWRNLTVNERRVIDALICQHFRYFQRSNGELQISYQGFERAGVSNKRHLRAAHARLIANGTIVRKQGVATRPGIAPPYLYELTMYRKNDGYIAAANRRFVWIPVAVMENTAWCGLSINARRIMDRLLIENARHKSEANGRLRVSYQQFEDCGIGARLISPALRELEQAGLLAITKGEQRGKFREPNLYRVTFYGTIDGPATWRAEPETNVVQLPRRHIDEAAKDI
jgi:hypothetical protein